MDKIRQYEGSRKKYKIVHNIDGWLLAIIHVKCYVRMYLVLVFANDLYIWKLICCVFLNGRFCLVSLKNPTFSNIFFHVPNTFWWLLNFERYVHVYVSFRCIFLICSCHLNNHPSILWTILYPSPDDGYYNRNVNVDFTYIHLFGLYFFLLPSYCRILSIFTFILSFRKKLIPNTFLHNI